MKSIKKPALGILLCIISFQLTIYNSLNAQSSVGFPEYYEESVWAPKLDSLREAIGGKVTFKNGDKFELAALLALSHYPLLHDRKVQIIVKKLPGAPVEASFSMWNFVKPRKGKIYKIKIEEGSFMERLTLNQQVSALAHEMAHFVQYDSRGYFGTLTTLVGWSLSKKARSKFEKGADKIAIEHHLGPQLLDFAFYTSDEEIRLLMNQKSDAN
ncbi:hypothetical protein J4E76_13535 [Fabibacter sp. E12]|nr:hypothetical protein [Roseivirga sp. E12]